MRFWEKATKTMEIRKKKISGGQELGGMEGRDE